ncbi:alpha/beta fold hydrolase [Sphingobium lactosutens]|uniref:alpha/beta fold hydrolase n=1 Tax=Sphingobium lactosutens TaxID=522773 RepID=UPI00191C0E94|nr:alpha/beta fold hydrolase [Sphingobium lactosutens]
MRLILVPGLLNDAALWCDQIDPLSETCEPVVADITRGETLAEMADAVLDAGGKTFALAGFSLGGIVAQQVIAIAPGRITHLALLDTTMKPDSAERAEERAFLTSLARNPGRFHGFGEKLLQRYLAPENLGNEAMADRIREMTARLGPEVFIRQSRIPRPDSHDILRTIKVPTLVLCGAHDQLTPPDVHREMASLIPQAKLAIVKHAGHMTPIETPDVVSVALKRLIER